MQQMMKPLTDIAHIIGHVITWLFDMIARPIATGLGTTPRRVWVRAGQGLLLVMSVWLVWQVINDWVNGPNESSPLGLAILTLIAYSLLIYLAYRVFTLRPKTRFTPMVETVATPDLPPSLRQQRQAPPAQHVATPDPESLKLLIQHQVQIAVENVTPGVVSKTLDSQLTPLIQQLMQELQTAKASSAAAVAETKSPGLTRKSTLFRFECETADVILVRMETSLYWEIELGSEFARGEKEVEELVLQALQSALTMSISERPLSDIKTSLRQVQEVVRTDALQYLKKYVTVKRLDFLVKQMSLPRDIVERATQQRATQAYSTDQLSATGTLHMPAQPTLRNRPEAEADNPA